MQTHLGCEVAQRLRVRSHCWSTLIEAIPAAVAAWMPMAVSSKDEAVCRGHSESFGGEQEGLGMRFAALVVSGADERVEFFEQVERFERRGHGLAGAPGDDGEGKASVAGLDDFEDFRDCGETRQVFVVEIFFADGDGFDRHIQAAQLIQG
jgi:hypothetical protein